MEWVNAVIQGVLLGGLYGLFAAGLSLIFGVMRLVNIAHGDLIVLAAYLALVVTGSLGIGPLPSLLLVVPLMAAIGYGALYGAEADFANEHPDWLLSTAVIRLSSSRTSSICKTFARCRRGGGGSSTSSSTPLGASDSTADLGPEPQSFANIGRTGS